MNTLASLAVALRALRVNMLRSGLTMLGIVIGVAAVITMVAVGEGAQERVREQIRSLGSNLIIILSGAITQGGARLGFGSQLTITEDDGYAIAREVDLVQATAPVTRGTVQTVFGNLNWGTVLYGITPDYLEVRDWDLQQGRAIAQEDVDAAAKVVLIGQTVANNLFGDADPLDQTIRVRKVPFTVIGVLAKKGQSMQGQDQDDAILVPISTARKRLLGGQQARQRAVVAISVKIRDGADMAEAESQIRDLLRQRHRLGPNQDDDFWLRNLSEVLETQQAAQRVMALLLAAVASVSLVVGGIGIMNIMLVSVTERTREIGLRMAVGARRRDILAQFLIEAVTLAAIGGLIGVGLGILAATGIAYFTDWPVRFAPAAIVLAVGFAAAVGVFFGFYPARKASRLEPMEALRFE
ncbi:ABC transporter permease [Ferrovibrio sp.]|uniref:ABC transporter permease n=1 Tax=Ferrovibrio sp. TaxID=1917215 RepID=UPI001B439EF7|nr:ABC transporter permease [Ferrovibrio sp.]MBP7064238.1 ABC transporter permease [Ferrovibrio sp.]